MNKRLWATALLAGAAVSVTAGAAAAQPVRFPCIELKPNPLLPETRCNEPQQPGSFGGRFPKAPTHHAYTS